MSIRRQTMKAPDQEDIKGKHKDTMKGMFDKKGKNSESFHAELLRSLEDNKARYDKQLYSDWLIKVYGRCTNICIKPQVVSDDGDQSTPVYLNGTGGKISLLREVEKQCARNCMRKYDRTYKTFDLVEKSIFDQFITDENIDPHKLLDAMQKSDEDQNARDIALGEKMVE